MWEYTAAFSPLWSRSPDLGIGQLDARDLGLPEELRSGLADWNARCEGAADPDGLRPVPVSATEWRLLRAEAFVLAARVQSALGDAWTVWCLAGGGDGGLRDAGGSGVEGGRPVLLRTGGAVTWTPDAVEPALDRFDAGLRRRIHAWVGAADRLPPAAVKADGLELAGALQAALPSGPVLWFGGGDPA